MKKNPFLLLITLLLLNRSFVAHVVDAASTTVVVNEISDLSDFNTHMRLSIAPVIFTITGLLLINLV